MDYITTNIQALKNTCVTSKSQTEYYKNKPSFKHPSKNTSSSKTINTSIPSDLTFGIKTKSNNATMRQLLQNNYCTSSSATHIKRKQNKKKRIILKSLTYSMNEKNKSSPKGSDFKMKKFLNVPSKIQSYINS